MTAQNPEALHLADKYEVEGFLQDHRFAQNEWCRKAAAELRRLHAENEALRSGYDASRLEIESLRARVQELGQMLRENRSKRIVALEAENLGLLHALAAEQDANADLRQQLEYEKTFAFRAWEAATSRCIAIVEQQQVPVGNSAAGEMAAGWTMDALREVRDAMRSNG